MSELTENVKLAFKLCNRQKDQLAALQAELEQAKEMVSHTVRQYQVDTTRDLNYVTTLQQENDQLRTRCEELESNHLACIKELYRLLNIDGSDGEYRFKWVAIEVADRVKRIEELEKENKTTIESYMFGRSEAFAECVEIAESMLGTMSQFLDQETCMSYNNGIRVVIRAIKAKGGGE